MPKVKTPKLYDKEVLDEYNYPLTRTMVLNFFSKYRTYSMQVGEICYEYNPTLSNDSMGIFSSKINDSTSKRALKIIEYEEYIKAMNKQFKSLRLRLTADEKIIFNYSILSNCTDEEVAEKLSMDKSNIYQRKKSCFIKVAQFFHIEVFN